MQAFGNNVHFGTECSLPILCTVPKAALECNLLYVSQKVAKRKVCKFTYCKACGFRIRAFYPDISLFEALTQS